MGKWKRPAAQRHSPRRVGATEPFAGHTANDLAKIAGRVQHDGADRRFSGGGLNRRRDKTPMLRRGCWVRRVSIRVGYDGRPMAARVPGQGEQARIKHRPRHADKAVLVGQGAARQAQAIRNKRRNGKSTLPSRWGGYAAVTAAWYWVRKASRSSG